MRKIRVVAVLTVILLFQIIGCNRNPNATLAPFTPTVLALTEVYGVMPTRYETSENAILASVEIEGIKFIQQKDQFLDSRRIKLMVHFKNISTNPVVFRKPITYGFLGVNPCLNDLEFIIEMKNGPQMNVTSNSNYPCSSETSPFPQAKPEDFLLIKPGEVYSYSLEIAPPGVLIEETKYVGKLPPGTYKLKVEYTNYDIGYDLPLEVTPPPSFDNPQARFDWYSNHTMIVDLNAWVGHVSSKEMEFTIP